MKPPVCDIAFALPDAQCNKTYLRPVHTERQRYCQPKKQCYDDRQMAMQPILPVTVPVKKIKGAARQRYVVTFGVNRLLKL